LEKREANFVAVSIQVIRLKVMFFNHTNSSARQLLATNTNMAMAEFVKVCPQLRKAPLENNYYCDNG
jgi:hypothetical protein